jgi:hypothetical protein
MFVLIFELSNGQQEARKVYRYFFTGVNTAVGLADFLTNLFIFLEIPELTGGNISETFASEMKENFSQEKPVLAQGFFCRKMICPFAR